MTQHTSSTGKTRPVRRPGSLAMQILGTGGLVSMFGKSLPGLALFTCAGWSHAQSSDQEPTWYQVEVVIFERLSGNRAGDAEIWPKDIELTYPADWRKLIGQDKAVTLLEELQPQDPAIELDGITPDETPLPDETRLGGAPSQGAPPTATDALTPAAEDTAPEVTIGDVASATDEELDEPLPPVLERPDGPELAFVRLPESERTLNESKGGIDRNRTMRVLFHEAWRQPIESADTAPAIIIQGGNTYDEHTEMEGSIRLTVSRYLHVHTNLWLTQFIPNYGQESDHWPPLPPVPERRQPTTNVEFALPPLDIGESEASSKRASPWSLETPAMEDYTSLIDQPFLIKEIVTLQQTRRMRSGELHYIDHPRLGLLIKIEPYTPDEDED